MWFGSNEFFFYIKDNIQNENITMYNKIYDVVKHDTYNIMSVYELSKEDREDILQEVEITVVRNLVKYLIESETCTEIQRNAWLRKVVKNKVYDYYRKRGRILEFIGGEDVLENATNEHDSIEECIIQQCDVKEVNAELLRAISKACYINTTPEKIIAFLLNKVLGALVLERTHGSPQEVIRMLEGKTLDVAFIIMKKEIQNALSVDIPDEIYEGLNQKLEQRVEGEYVKNRRFHISARTITDSSSWIKSKLENENVERRKHK